MKSPLVFAPDDNPVKSLKFKKFKFIGSVVVLVLFYVHGKHLRSCRDGQLT